VAPPPREHIPLYTLRAEYPQTGYSCRADFASGYRTIHTDRFVIFALDRQAPDLSGPGTEFTFSTEVQVRFIGRHGDDEAMKKKWNFMVYLAGDNNLCSEMVWSLLQMIDAAEAWQYGDNVRVIAQFDPLGASPGRYRIAPRAHLAGCRARDLKLIQFKEMLQLSSSPGDRGAGSTGARIPGGQAEAAGRRISAAVPDASRRRR